MRLIWDPNSVWSFFFFLMNITVFGPKPTILIVQMYSKNQVCDIRPYIFLYVQEDWYNK